MSRIVHDGPAVYLNADRSAVVDGATSDAAFVLVGPGGEVPIEYEALYRDHFGGDGEPAETPKSRVVQYDGDAPEPTFVGERGPEIVSPPKKPRKRAAKRPASD